MSRGGELVTVLVGAVVDVLPSPDALDGYAGAGTIVTAYVVPVGNTSVVGYQVLFGDGQLTPPLPNDRLRIVRVPMMEPTTLLNQGADA